MRRLYLDLIGLPPAPEEVDAFLADGSPVAYEQLVERLLASPHFGERWGRHWLDEAGYTDTLGGDNDFVTGKQPLGVPGKWKYRDYVIDAINRDKPYDRFLTEQLAGDELVDWRGAPQLSPAMSRLLQATGFLRVAADDTGQDVLNTPDIRYGGPATHRSDCCQQRDGGSPWAAPSATTTSTTPFPSWTTTV